jgi:hypothetical protein
VNPLLEIVIEKGLLLDAAGVIGLGLVALAAVKLARKDCSWGGTMMASGAIALLVARLYLLTSPHFLTREIVAELPAFLVTMMGILPTGLLTFGLAGIVWGLWGHERWLREESGGSMPLS